jgi:hypothetical protein
MNEGGAAAVVAEVVVDGVMWRAVIVMSSLGGPRVTRNDEEVWSRWDRQVLYGRSRSPIPPELSRALRAALDAAEDAAEEFGRER